MKKILMVAVALSLAFTVKAFAADEVKKSESTTTTKTVVTTPVKATTPTTTTTAVKPENKPTTTATSTTTTTTTTTTESILKGNFVKMDPTKNLVTLKDNAGKEWSFKYDNKVSLKDYKAGDNVEVKYEKDNLKSIAKVTLPTTTKTEVTKTTTTKTETPKTK